LFLEVKGKSYWLSFDGDEELYGWLDHIIHHCHLSHITTPKNFVHHVHVSYDYIAGRFQVFLAVESILRMLRRTQGLPIQWQHIVDERSEYFEEEDEVETSSGIALQNTRIIGPKFVLRRPPSLHPDTRGEA
jgi:hypothetical protein